MVDYGEKAKNPPFSTSLKVTVPPSYRFFTVSNTLPQVLNILQDHYPERLGRAFVINVPFLLNAFYKMINPLMDPVTREKLKFNPALIKDGHFDSDMLIDGSWGGSRTVEYVHEKYWPALLKLTGERKEKQKQKWRELGGKIGVKEWDYKAEVPDKAEEVEEKGDEKGEDTIETSVVAVAVQA